MTLRLVLLVLAAWLVPRGATADPPPAREWTVLLYMAADDGTEAVESALPPRAYRDLHALAAGGPAGGAAAERGTLPPDGTGAGAPPVAPVAVVVELDLFEPDGVWRFHVPAQGLAWDADRPLEEWADETPDDIAAEVLALRTDESIAPAAALEQFLDWGSATYPARRYAVIVWGHGYGWRPRDAGGAYRDESRGGLASDDSQQTVLSIPDVRDALRAVSDRQLEGRPFDLFVADACLMQSVEVATELRDVARYILGFEQIEYTGLPYHALVPALLAPIAGGADVPPAQPERCPPADAACAAAVGLVAAQRAAHENAAQGGGTYTVAVVDSAALAERLLPALAALAAAIPPWLAEDAPWRGVELARTLGELARNPGLGRSAIFRGGTRDLGAFLDQLRDAVAPGRQSVPWPSAPAPEGAAAEPAAAEPAAGATAALVRAIQDAREALAETVVARAIGSDYHQPTRMAGLAVWLPQGAQELPRVDFFARSRFYEALRPAPGEPSRWRTWVEQTFAPPPPPSSPALGGVSP